MANMRTGDSHLSSKLSQTGLAPTMLRHSPRVTKALALVSTVTLAGLGFNTLDQMIWGFKWETFWKQVDFWDMGPFTIPQWYAFMFFGIIPLALGFFLLGWLSHKT